MTRRKCSIADRASQIRFVAMDVDGVLTGGEVIVLDSGEEVKLWNSKDRLVLAMIRDRQEPLILAWLTGRSSNAVSRAARDLGIPHLVQKCRDKLAALKELLTVHHLSLNQAAFIGDDIIDLPPMKVVGLAACPSDATRDVLENAHYISPFSGGRGAVRDVLEYILRTQKKWNDLVNSSHSF